MRRKSIRLCCAVILSALALAAAGTPLRATELHHTTYTDFTPGDFFQTTLLGSEAYPEIFLDSYAIFSWTFDDDAISGWSYAANESGNIAEESPSGQIHLAAQFISAPSGSYGLAHRTDVSIPDKCSVEYRLFIDALDPSGTSDPFVTQPTGACCRLDLLRTDIGFRVDIFSDRITSFYREGETGIDYPVNASIDIPTDTGQWYTFRFDVDFNDPDLATQVFRDGGWIGELKADTRNASSQRIRPMAFSRGSSSGLAEMHVDYVRLGTSSSEYYSSGTYTSDVLELLVSEFSQLTWDEVAAVPHPWESWTKYAGNPILAGPALVENMLVDIEDPLQQPIQYDGKYWFCYSSGGPGQSICLAYTTDPALLSWTDYESNPVLAPITGENFVFSPHLFKDGSTYYLFYDVALSSDSRQRIAYATAPAPTGPWTRGQIVLEMGEPGEWDDYRVAEPFIVKEGDTYYLYHMGNYNSLGDIEQIGVSTTTAALFPLGPEAGGLWTKLGVALSPNPDPGEWDGGLVSNPSVIRFGSVYFMRYSGSIDNVGWRAGLAWATDPSGPFHRTESIDLDIGSPGAWDDVKVLRGAIHYHQGKWYCLYTGGGETTGWTSYQVGMATANPRSVGDALSFETRTSADGSLWEDWLTIANGDFVQSTPENYFQYRTTFNDSPEGLSPVLTGVHIEPNGPVDVSVIPDYDLINCSTSVGYTFYIDASAKEVRGVDITFSIDSAVITIVDPTPGGDFTEGTFLSDVGGTFFDVVDNGDGVYVVNCAILGGDTGAIGSGELFSVIFTPVASGNSTVAITSLQVRDPDNTPLEVVAGDSQVQVDCTMPTMEPIVESEGGWYNATPVLSNFGFDDNLNLDLAEYNYNGAAWTTIFSGIDAISWDSDDWELPGFAGLSEGSHTIFFRVKDDAGNWNGEGTPDTYSWQFFKDTESPAPPTAFLAMPGHEQVHLTWANPSGDVTFAGVEIRCMVWDDYPQYGTPGPDAPEYPASETDGDPVTQTGLEAYNDPIGARNIYYYAAFSYDMAGNYSIFDAGAADRSTNYWLGDIATEYDGYVTMADLVLFSNAFGAIQDGLGWINEADFGPTDDWSRFGIPEPDNVIDFEDMMILSMNYDAVEPEGFEALAVTDHAVENLEELVAFKSAPNDDGSISIILVNEASTLKGIHLVATVKDGTLERVERGALFSGASGLFFGLMPCVPNSIDISAAALGVDAPMTRSGEVVRLVVRSDAGSAPRIRIEEIDLRDLSNVKTGVVAEEEFEAPFLPNATALLQNYPNPFNPVTTLIFDMTASGHVRIDIYDVSGRLVGTPVNEMKAAGRHLIEWNGRNASGSLVPSGIYFYRMKISDFVATRKMILVR